MNFWKKIFKISLINIIYPLDKQWWQNSIYNLSNLKDSKLCLARAYFSNKEYLKSKDAFLDYQSNNRQHSKYADSMFELSRVLIKLNEVSENINIYE